MSRLPDLVLDSRLRTQFYESIIVHSYLEIDNEGGRFSRQESWKAERFLGRGGFGQVRLERCTTNGTNQNTLRAVKIIHKPLKPSESFDFHRELEIISKFSNNRYKRWFVKSFGWFEDPSSIFIAMEYCRHGDLHHYLISQRTVPVEEVQQLTYQMLEALDQMHQNDFAHRDLKPGNILIKSMPPDRKWWIVLADFGITKRADESNGPTTTIKGTASFMAPELLGFLDQFRPKSIADFKATDTWALGEIVFQMLTGEAAFQNPMELMTYCLGQRGFPLHRLPESIGDDCHEFVTSIMTARPHDRMTTAQSLKHRWVQSLNIEEEFAALTLQHNSPMISPIAHNESASARWSNLSDLETRTTQTTAIWAPETLKPAYPSAGSQTGLGFVSYKPTIRKARTHTPTPIQTLVDHNSPVKAVAYSPDNKWMATGSMDKTVKLWDTSNGKCFQTLQHDSAVSSVAISSDSIWLASGLVDSTIKLWDVNSGKCLQTFRGHSLTVYSVAFSPDCTWLASGSGDTLIKLWDLSGGGKCSQTLDEHFNMVYSIAFSSAYSRMASGSADMAVKVWDMRGGNCFHVLTLKGHTMPVYSVAFAPDSMMLASCSGDSKIKLWDASSGECLQTLEGHSAAVNSVAFSPKPLLLASGSGDQTVKLWHTRSGKCLYTYSGYTRSVLSVIFSPGSTRLATGSLEGAVKIWRIAMRLHQEPS